MGCAAVCSIEKDRNRQICVNGLDWTDGQTGVEPIWPPPGFNMVFNWFFTTLGFSRAVSSALTVAAKAGFQLSTSNYPLD